MSFYGRDRLLADLRQRLDRIRADGAGQLLAVRGRRQVGKSRLITRFVEQSGLPYLYFSAVKNAAPAAQMRALTEELHTATTPLRDADSLFATPPADWRDAFGRIALACRDTPSIVVFDEFPWAAATDPTLEGYLQNAWDKQLEGAPVFFILIGSDVTMMERLTEHDRPLYGRAKGLTVRPFDPAECAEVLGADRSAMDAFDAVLVTGGYPRLMLDLARCDGTEDFVRAQLQDENGDLVVMGQRSLDAEFPDAAQARRVLTAIGGQPVGLAGFTQVVGRLPETGSAGQTAVARALKVLDDKGVVSIDVPVGAIRTTKLRRYRIADPYLRFWFRFVEGQQAHISRGRPDIPVSRFARGWASWRGRAVEPLLHEAVSRLAADRAERSTDQPEAEAGEVGSWWNRDNSREYDVVIAAAGAKRVLEVGSVKWREGAPFERRDLDRLAEARSDIPGAAAARLLAICPSGTVPDLPVDRVLAPQDLLTAWQH
ncbi:ATP-binding protein [Phaeacidiphilus oryzae]|jgi:AAA+ ATPase superfamily predicted ATPase|uniref:ATP-binding protein n=1 Tax=Phaeacidiphilus oryzae TaxID=348818 RepID=UPI000565BCE0|nr:ATP-binding protein [Phaeacidiphilus oryzae]